ncbi:hypothetical protein BDW69DRAFT_186971 [Aspergillus filifer]
MNQLSSIFSCWGARKQGGRNSSARQEATQVSGELTDFVGDMPPFKEGVKPAQEPYYVNGVEDQITERERIDSDSDRLPKQSTVVDVEVQTIKTPIEPDSDGLSVQVTANESLNTVIPDRHDDLRFYGSTNAIPTDPSGKLMVIFSWTLDIDLDSLELVHVFPEPDKKSGLVEGMFRYNNSLVPIFITLQYAEQRECQSRRLGVSQPEAPIEKTPTDHEPGNQVSLSCSTGFLPLPPTPPTSPTLIGATSPTNPNGVIDCENMGAFTAWAQGPSLLDKTC